MKRGVLVLLLVLVLNLVLVSAAVNDSEQTKINKAYSCLQNKTSGNCASLSIQEKTFSVLAGGQCRTELTAASDSGNCWPSGNCKVKETAQAALALRTNPPLDWLQTKNQTPSELTWYLEIEADAAATCTIGYGSSSYSVFIDEDKKINSDAGSCLLLDSDGYWLRISNSCHNTPFTISCNEDFLTTTLFRKQGSGTVHISSQASSAAAGGSTTEEISAYCFADSGACNYEGTLWAALALDNAGRNVDPYLPYLITFAPDNGRFVPNSFLYHLTANEDYRLSLLSQQKNNQYWMESGDRYYDSALALYSLKQDTSQEKTKAKTWLLNTQDSNGCWENNLRNTAFILASVWPGSSPGGGGGGGSTQPNCETQGNYCSSSAECTSAGGSVLDSYTCSGFGQKCCSVEPPIKTCSELGGEICSSNQRCIGGTEPGAADAGAGEICCASGGYCSAVVGEEGSECEINDGVCRSGSCGSDEEEGSFSCESLSQTCCVQEGSDGGIDPTPGSSGGSSLWIWILLILIVLVVIGILLREKIRMFWFRISHGGSGSPPPHRPNFPGFMQPIQRIERRILVPHHTPAPAQKPVMTRMKSGAQKELDEVLRKLKDMGK